MLLGGKHWAREGDERSAGRRGQLRRPSHRCRYRYRYSTVPYRSNLPAATETGRDSRGTRGPGVRRRAGGLAVMRTTASRRARRGRSVRVGSRRCVCQRPRSCCTERRGARAARGVVEEVTIPLARRYCTVCTVQCTHSRSRAEAEQGPWSGKAMAKRTVRSATSSNGLLCRLGAAAEPWRGGRGRGAGSRWI